MQPKGVQGGSSGHFSICCSYSLNSLCVTLLSPPLDLSAFYVELSASSPLFNMFLLSQLDVFIHDF